MNFHLVVVQAFAGLTRGDIVADATQIAEILAGEHAHSVVRVAAPSPKEG